jgi:hypothetical protein
MFSVKPLEDLGVITKSDRDMTDIGTVMLYNCLELHGLFVHGKAIHYHYKTFIYKPPEFANGGAFYFEISVDPPYNRLLRYQFPFDLWEPSLMAFALTNQVLFMAGPKPCFEGEALPEECGRVGLSGLSSTVEALHASIDESIKKHGGLLVRIGPDTWNIVRLLYMQNTLRGMVKRPDPSKFN